MKLNAFPFLLALLLYFAVMISIGIYFGNKNRNISDYILGSRHLGAWVTSLSAEASDMSGWLLMGLPGLAYACGGCAIWIALGLILGTYANWKWVASRLRAYTEIAGNSLTIPDFFQNRFNSRSNIIRIFSAIFIFFFFVVYVSSGLIAGGKLFSLVLPVSYLQAVYVTAFITATYTLLGGFSAVCWTDAIQGAMMFLAIIGVPIVATHHCGGIGKTIQTLLTSGKEFVSPLLAENGNILRPVKIISMLAWGLGYFGQPHVLARFMAIRSVEEIPLARRIAMYWVTWSLLAAVFAGILGHFCLPAMAENADVENIFLLLVNNLFSPFFLNLVLLGILAAIMSSASSQLLVAASSFSRDLYAAVFRKGAKSAELLMISRGSVLIASILAVVLARNPNSLILNVVAHAWAGFGACLGPALLFSLFWRRTTERGVLAGVITGGITVLLWKKFMPIDLYEIIPGFFISSLAIVAFSFADKQPSCGILRAFNAAKDAKFH
ncbi:MAG: sodium/proline symporter PutP [Puniceicoccales bacterium]|jgi:sodium/proline symporter|nr:sodium/proline symporter PutP [Puniceicoccales bacterium]